MRHRIGYNRLSRTSTHRRAMINNMMTSLFRSERIKTTKAKALEVRRHAEKTITRAKTDTVHNRRLVSKRINDKEILSKLFNEISPKFASRPGGYTRIIKLGQRTGDAADMVLLELVGETEEKKSSKKKAKKSSKKADKDSSAKAVSSKAVSTADADADKKEDSKTE